MSEETTQAEPDLLMLRSGATVYLLGTDGTNRVWATVQTRPADDELAETTAELLRLVFNVHEDLVAACEDIAQDIEDTFSESDLTAGGKESLLGGYRDKLRAVLAKVEVTK